jgi:polyisoprenoid-binding protein YceI
MGVPVSGRFKPFNTKLAFDPAEPAAALIASSVAIGSAALGDREPDTELLKPVRFVVALVLQANVRSTTVKRLDVIRFDVASKLSIKGVSSHVVVPVTLAQTGAQTGASGSFSPSASLFGRLTFWIGDRERSDTWVVVDAAQVSFRLMRPGALKRGVSLFPLVTSGVVRAHHACFVGRLRRTVPCWAGPGR